MEEEDYATLQALIRTLGQELANLHSSPYFEVEAMCCFLPWVKNFTLAAYDHQGKLKLNILRLLHSFDLVFFRLYAEPCT